MKFLITGGAGFIGSHLCNALVKKGHKISVVDNLFRGKYENIELLINNENSFYNIDMSDKNNINKLADIIKKSQPEVIVHYAAINGTQYFYDLSAKVLDDNTMITYNLLEALKKIKQDKISSDCNPIVIFSSSSEVYGEPFNLPTSENDMTYIRLEENRDCYAASKLFGEFFIKHVCDEIGIDWLILRIFNVYGENMVGTKYGQVVPEFINRLENKEYPLNIFGDGTHRRSFCYIEDHINITLELIEKKVKNEVINLGNPVEVSILDLARIIMEKLGLAFKVNYLHERSGDHKRRQPDISKLTKIIGDYTFISLDDGIGRIIENKRCKH
ncbi:MAG: SDR family NAD(P)-dependent oxidoreductase [Acholeplasma sp.]|jgi:nucleoside-diphosphate-sugar epimerase|nr:SDR family NAD(P)-dependent oxidoreductase [Acholeplasma sp.]